MADNAAGIVGVELLCAIMEKRPSRESVSGFTWKEMDHRLTEEQILRWFDIKTAFAWVPIAGPRDIIALLTCEMTP